MSFVREFSESANGKHAREILSKVATAAIGGFLGLLLFAAVVFAVALCWIALAQARDNSQWGDRPANVREWFQSLMQPDNPYMSCCGEADAFEADTFEQSRDGHYEAIITDGKGIIPAGTHIIIPDAKIKWDMGNPTGHGWVFIGNQGQVYCYVTPGGV